MGDPESAPPPSRKWILAADGRSSLREFVLTTTGQPCTPPPRIPEARSENGAAS